MLRITLLRSPFSQKTYYPFILSPTYELLQYSPAYTSDVKKLKIEESNSKQINADTLPKFLTQQIEADKRDFLKRKEIIFMGRSNCGKSSLINRIFGNKKIARSAKSPGTTKFLHFHKISLNKQDAFLVDCPGYGFANMNKRRRQLWFGLLNQYLKVSSRLCQVFQIINFEHGLKPNDELALQKVSKYNVNIQLVFNKVDKVAKTKFFPQVKAINEAVRRLNLPNINNRLIMCSSKTDFGIQILRCRIAECLQNSQQRNIDENEQLLLQYLKEMRVSGMDLKSNEKELSRPYVVRKLIYNSKLTKFLM